MDRHEAGTAGYIHKRCSLWGLPGGLVIESLPGNAADKGWIPGLGRPNIPQNKYTHALQLLSHMAQLLKPLLLRVRAPQQKSSPRSLSLERAATQQLRPSTAKREILQSFFKKETVTVATWGKQVAKGWEIFQAKGCEVMPKNSEIMWKYQDQILTLKRYVYKPS